MAALMRVVRGAWRASFIVAACLAMTLPPARAQNSSVANSAAAARGSLAEKAHALEARGRPDLAIQLWQQILLSDPRNTDALVGLAKDYKLIGSDSLADQTLDRLHAINPNDPITAGTQPKSSPSPSPSPSSESRQLEGSSLSTPPIASTPPITSPNPPSPTVHSASKVALNTPSTTAPGPSSQHLDEKAPSARDAASGAYSAPQRQQPTPPQPTQPDSSASSSANTSSTQTTVPVRPPSKPAPAKNPSAEPTPVVAQSNHRLPGKSTRRSAQQSTQPQKQPTQTLAEALPGTPEIPAPNSGPAPTEAEIQSAPTHQPQPETTSGTTCLNPISEPIGVYAGGNTSIDYLVSLFTAHIQWQADDENQDAFTRGPGGYFSPQANFLANAPLNWQGDYGARWHYNFASAFDTQAFWQEPAPHRPIAGDKALETSQNNPMLPNLSSISPGSDLDSLVAYQIATHWFTGAYLAANNTCNFPYISDGFFGRYTLRQQPFAVATPAGLFSAAGQRPFTVQ